LADLADNTDPKRNEGLTKSLRRRYAKALQSLGSIPSIRRPSSDSAGSAIISPGEVSNVTSQALPRQVSTRPEPSGSLTTGESAPEALAGPAKTVRIGAIDPTNGDENVQSKTNVDQNLELAKANLLLFRDTLKGIAERVKKTRL